MCLSSDPVPFGEIHSRILAVHDLAPYACLHGVSIQWILFFRLRKYYDVFVDDPVDPLFFFYFGIVDA